MAGRDWDERQLCPDGACVGVIGADGTCKVCGRVAPGWGDERQRGLYPPEDSAEDEPLDGDADADANADDVDDAGDESAPVAGSPEVEAPVEAWDDRQLCPDGSCIGVVAADGRCTVCGKSATAQAS